MARNTRRANVIWDVTDDAEQVHRTTWQNFWAAGSLAVLMDIRDELQKLNALLHCSNFQRMPHELRDIATEARAKARARRERAKRARTGGQS